MTAFYMFRLMGKTFYGESHVDPERRAEDPRVAAADDGAADPAGDPVDLHRHAALGLPFGDGPHQAVAGAGVRRGREEILEPQPEPFQLVRHRRRADPRQRRGAALGMPSASGTCSASSAAARAAAGRRVTDSTGATPFLYRASLNKWWFDDLNDLLFVRIGGRVAAALWWFDRRGHRRHGQRHRRTLTQDGRAAGCARIQTAGSRTTRWGSRSACSSWRVGFLVIVVAAAMTALNGLPLVSLRHLRAADRRDRSLAFLPREPAAADPLRRRSGRADRWAAVASLMLVASSRGARRRVPVQERVAWIPAFGINYHVGVDGMSLVAGGAHDDADLDQHPGQLRADQGRG